MNNVIALVLVCSACDSKPIDPATSPIIEVQRAYAADKNAVRGLRSIATPDQLLHVLDCPSEGPSISDDEVTIRVHDNPSSDSAVRPELDQFRVVSKVMLAKGNAFENCVVREPFELREYEYRIRAANITWQARSRVISLDGSWRVLFPRSA